MVLILKCAEKDKKIFHTLVCFDVCTVRRSADV